MVVALGARSEEHTSELQSHLNLVCRLLLEKKKIIVIRNNNTTKRVMYAQLQKGMSLTLARQHSHIRHRMFLFLVLLNIIAYFFFFNDTATTKIYPLPLHDALPI